MRHSLLPFLAPLSLPAPPPPTPPTPSLSSFLQPHFSLHSESYVLEQIKISAQKQFRKVKKAHIGMRWNLLLDSILSIIEVPDQTENGNMLQIMMGAIGQRSPRPR
mmetsp:Transcript_27546/g.89717  ORF Transcript_27546/g.89717 Transcript_27546/m.89717 type:complete len:106 (-) Transcript_27546:78-395(-)